MKVQHVFSCFFILENIPPGGRPLGAGRQTKKRNLTQAFGNSRLNDEFYSSPQEEGNENSNDTINSPP